MKATRRSRKWPIRAWPLHQSSKFWREGPVSYCGCLIQISSHDSIHVKITELHLLSKIKVKQTEGQLWMYHQKPILLIQQAHWGGAGVWRHYDSGKRRNALGCPLFCSSMCFHPKSDRRSTCLILSVYNSARTYNRNSFAFAAGCRHRAHPDTAGDVRQA